MAVDRRRAHLRADPVKEVAERAHVAGIVLIARDHLIDRVDDHRRERLALHPPDEQRREPVQRQRVPAQVPDDDVFVVPVFNAHRPVDGEETPDAARRVDLEVHVQHLPLPAGETQPRPALGDGDRQLNEQETLGRLARPGDQRLVPAPQHAGDQLRRLFGRLLHVAQRDRLRQKRQFLGVLQPLAPRASADVRRQQCLHCAAPHRARHPAQPRGVLVGVVHREATRLQEAKQVVDALPVLLFAGRVDVHHGMDALTCGVHEAGDGQFVFAVKALLFLPGQRVGLDEYIAEGDDVFVRLPLAVQGVHPYPRAALWAVGADDLLDAAALFQAFDKVRRLQGEVGVDGLVPAVAVRLHLCGKAHGLLRLIERFDIAGEHPGGRGIRIIRKIRGGGKPAVPAGQSEYAAHGDRAGRAPEARPAAFAVAGDVAGIVPRPFVPHLTRIARVLQRHAGLQPLGVTALPDGDAAQGRKHLIHGGPPPFPR